jgi:hypothetical protein
MLKFCSQLGLLALLLGAYGCSKNQEKLEPNVALFQETWQNDVLENRYIVQFHEADIINHAKQFKNKPSVEFVIQDFAQLIATNYGADLVATDLIYSSAIKGFTLTATPAQAQKLKSDNRIKFIEPDQVFILAKGGKRTMEVALSNQLKQYLPELPE